MNLIRAEWKRYFARRFIRVMLAVVVVILAAVALGTADHSTRITATERARAQQRMDADIAAGRQQIAACEQAQTATPVAPQYQLFPGQTCEDFGSGTPSLVEYLPSTWTLADQGRDAIVILGGLFALLAFATGASFIGAEWHSGGMMNLLLWRPRRLALLTQKLGALLLAVLASGLGLGVVWALMIWGLVSTRGQVGHMTAGTWRSYGLVEVRALALGLVIAVIGFAIASIGRHTAAALGVAVGYVVIVEAGGMAVLNSINIARPERFLLSRYVAAWLFKNQQFYGAEVCTPVDGNGINCSPGAEWVMRMGSAAEVIGILAAVLLVWAYVSFWRRDVT